jgi:cell filamentation protein
MPVSENHHTGPDQRQRAATNARAWLALEGLHLDADTQALLAATVRAQISADDLYAELRRAGRHMTAWPDHDAHGGPYYPEPDTAGRREPLSTAAALYRLDLDPVPGGYDLRHLQDIHAALYVEVHPRAGQPRTTNLAKNGEVFCPPQHIHTQARQIFDSLAAEDHLRGLDLDPFSDRLANYYADLTGLHPFADGNGHTQRVLFTQLAREAGYEIRWERLDPRAHVEACRETFYGDREPLRILLSDAVHPHHPVYGTPDQTADLLHRRAEDAGVSARNLNTKARQWYGLGQPGPNQRALVEQRCEEETVSQTIATARTAQSDYQAAVKSLTYRETVQRELVDRLAATTILGRPRLRGEDRARVQRDLEDLNAHIDEIRGVLDDQAGRVGAAFAAAPPPEAWKYHEERARCTAGQWDTLTADARHADRIVAAGRYAFGEWLTRHAEELTGLAEAIHTGQITPEQADTPLAADLPPPAAQPIPAPAPAAGGGGRTPPGAAPVTGRAARP